MSKGLHQPRSPEHHGGDYDDFNRLDFQRIEDKHGKKVFGAARRKINQAAFHFIGLFLAQLACLIVRSLPIFAGRDIALSLFNGGFILLLLGSVLTLMDIMGVVRALTPAE